MKLTTDEVSALYPERGVVLLRTMRPGAVACVRRDSWVWVAYFFTPSGVSFWDGVGPHLSSQPVGIDVTPEDALGALVVQDLLRLDRTAEKHGKAEAESKAEAQRIRDQLPNLHYFQKKAP